MPYQTINMAIPESYNRRSKDNILLKRARTCLLLCLTEERKQTRPTAVSTRSKDCIEDWGHVFLQSILIRGGQKLIIDVAGFPYMTCQIHTTQWLLIGLF